MLWEDLTFGMQLWKATTPFLSLISGRDVSLIFCWNFFDFLFASSFVSAGDGFQQEPTSTSIPLRPEVSTWSAGEAPPTAEALRSWKAMDHAVCNKLPTYQWRTRIVGCFTGEMKGWFQCEGVITCKISAIFCLRICFLHCSLQVSCI